MPKSAQLSTTPAIEAVAQVLAGYAERGIFRGFSRGPVAKGKAAFQIAWHRGRTFELSFAPGEGRLLLAELLTGVPAGSTMYRELKAFIKERQAVDLPEHRRIDPARAEVSVRNRAGNISLAVRVQDGDNEYATRKLVHLVNEIYLTFLAEGKYFDYLIETFDLDPDRM